MFTEWQKYFHIQIMYNEFCSCLFLSAGVEFWIRNYKEFQNRNQCCLFGVQCSIYSMCTGKFSNAILLFWLLKKFPNFPEHQQNPNFHIFIVWKKRNKVLFCLFVGWCNWVLSIFGHWFYRFRRWKHIYIYFEQKKKTTVTLYYYSILMSSARV